MEILGVKISLRALVAFAAIISGILVIYLGRKIRELDE